MEDNKSLSFDQLPSAVGELLTKVNTMMTRLDDIGQRIGNAPNEDNHVLMDIREASAFVRKKVSSLYAYTSESASLSTREATRFTSSKTS
jgi:hypothetical protein